jgi:hypothetical protein
MDLPAYVQMLEDQQRALRSAARALAGADDSPKLREAQRAAERAERKLGEEIGPLKEKIEAAANKAMQPPGASGSPAPTVSTDELKKAVAALQATADEAALAIDAAAGKLHAGKPSEAVKPQSDVIEKFNQIYRSVAPFPNLVGRAAATQQGLVDATPPLPSSRAREAGRRAPGVSPAGSALPSSRAREAGEGSLQEAAWNQEFVTRYSEMLAPMAKEGLKQLESTAQSPLPPSTSSATPSGGTSATDAEKAQKQREALKKSMEKAVELGPRIESLSDDAVQLLRDRKPGEALPKQQEALKLLKEIADLLPKQDQNQDQDEQNQNKQDQKKKDQKQDKSDQKQQPKPDQKDEKQNERETAQQQAEAEIRQVQERQEKRREMEKQLRRYLISSGTVDKDW